MLTPEQREELRTIILEELVARQGTAPHPRALRRSVEKGTPFRFTDEDWHAGLDFLDGAELVELIPDPVGSTRYPKATPKGILQTERGGGR